MPGIRNIQLGVTKAKLSQRCRQAGRVIRVSGQQGEGDHRHHHAEDEQHIHIRDRAEEAAQAGRQPFEQQVGQEALAQAITPGIDEQGDDKDEQQDDRGEGEDGVR